MRIFLLPLCKRINCKMREREGEMGGLFKNFVLNIVE